jgi:hypothetical protein
MALRWFVGGSAAVGRPDVQQEPPAPLRQSGVPERLLDETVRRAMAEALVSRHVSADGTLVRVDASYKSFLPIKVALDPEEYGVAGDATTGGILTGRPISAIAR